MEATPPLPVDLPCGVPHFRGRILPSSDRFHSGPFLLAVRSVLRYTLMGSNQKHLV